MIQKISFGESPKVNNTIKINNESKNVEKDTNSSSTVKLLGLVALAATTLGGIYYLTKGKKTSNLTKKSNEFVNHTQEPVPLKINEQAQEISTSNIPEKINKKANTELNEQPPKSLEEVVEKPRKEEIIDTEKYFTGVRTRVDKETLSTIVETFKDGKLIKRAVSIYDEELGKVNKVTTFDPETGKLVLQEIIGNTYDRNYNIIKSDVVFQKEAFNEKGKLISKYNQDNGPFTIWKQLEIYNPVTGKPTSNYYCAVGNLHVRNFEADGDTIKNYISISGVKTENFDEAVELYKKYIPLSDNEIKKLYRQKLENSEGISELEFRMIEGNHDLRFDTAPLTSEKTVVEEHGAINGFNNRVREFVKGEMKDPDEIKYLKPRMDKIDQEMANLPPLEKDCVFYRGVADKYISNIINGQIGDVIVPDEGYAYGAFHRELAQRFAQTLLVIRTPKGAKISRCGANGGEVLYPRGAEYRILSKNKSPDGQNIIELEYVLPKTE